MRDDVAVMSRHRMMRGLNRIDGLAARRETGQEAAGDERVERRRERRVVAAFEFAAEADIALARPRLHPVDGHAHLAFGDAARRGAAQDPADQLGRASCRERVWQYV